MDPKRVIEKIRKKFPRSGFSIGKEDFQYPGLKKMTAYFLAVVYPERDWRPLSDKEIKEIKKYGGINICDDGTRDGIDSTQNGIAYFRFPAQDDYDPAIEQLLKEMH